MCSDLEDAEIPILVRIELLGVSWWLIREMQMRMPLSYCLCKQEWDLATSGGAKSCWALRLSVAVFQMRRLSRIVCENMAPDFEFCERARSQLMKSGSW